MSANANPPSDSPTTPPLDSSTSSSSTLPPRRLVRLLFDSSRPFYLLDSQDVVRFANRMLLDTLRLSETELDGLDCSRVLANDEHPRPAVASLLAIPEQARMSDVSIGPIGDVQHAIAPWVSRLVIPLDSHSGQSHVACLWLRADDPLVIQASQHAQWSAQNEVRAALLDARRSLTRLDGLHCLIGNSPAANLARRQTQAAIAGNMSICICGPVGSRKATLARAIHQQRRKRDRRSMTGGKLLPIDCRLMDRALIQETIELAKESEAKHPADGDIEPTAFLLLGVDLLGQDAFEPLVAFLTQNPSMPVFATSRTNSLQQLHPDQAWQDIVASINVMNIHLEPLSNRPEDIAPLVESILEEIRISSSGQVRRSLSLNAVQWLQAYPWPGNLRELSHAIHDACKASTGSVIEPNHFSLAIRTFASHVLKPEPIAPLNLDQTLEDFERGVLQKAIDAFPRNRAAAARHLGISRTRLLRRLAQLGFEASPQEVQPIDFGHPHEDTTPALDQPIFEEIPEEP